MNAQKTTLLDGRVALLQSENGLRVTMDTVLVAAGVRGKAGDSFLDMGCGTGGVGLCILERLKDLDLNLTGIDIQQEMIDLAQQNAPQASFIYGDIADKTVFKAEQFDHIVMNPPYFEQGKKQACKDSARDTAFSADDFEIWMERAVHWVKQKGSLTLIHKAENLDDILRLSHKKFGALEIWFVHAKPQEDAIRVIIRMIRGRNSPLTIHPPIIMRDKNNNESLQSKAILRDGMGLI